MKTSILTIIFLIATQAQTHAQTQTQTQQKLFCKTHVFKSPCASGVVSVEISRDKFLLHYGDVKCWGLSVEFDGTLTPSQRPRKSHRSVIFDLQAENRIFPDTGSKHRVAFKVADIEIEEDSKVAHLRVNPDQIRNGIGGEYYLSCSEKTE